MGRMSGRKLLIALAVLLLLGVAAAVATRMVLGSSIVPSQLEQQLSARLGQPVHIGSATAAIFPRIALDMREVRIGRIPSVRFDRVQVATNLRGLFSRTIDDGEIIVSGGRMTLPLPFSLVPDAGAGAPDASGSGLTVNSIRKILFRGVTVTAADQSLAIDLDSSIVGDRLEINRLTAKAAKTRIDAKGALTSIATMEGALQATADPLDLDEMIAIGSALAAPDRKQPSPTRPSGTPGLMHVTVDVKSPRGHFGAYDFQHLATSIDAVPGRFTLKPLSVQMFGGAFQGRLDAETGGPLPVLKLNGSVSGLDVAQVLKSSGSAGGLTGRLSGTITVVGIGDDAAALMRTAHGTIDAAVANGTVPHLDMVRTVVLAFGKPSGDVRGSGSAFTRLGGTFALANSTLTSDSLALESRDFDMRGHGTLRVDSGVVSARTDVALSRDLTAQAGTDLRRYAQEDGRVVVPATIGGTLDAPRVSLDVAAATRRAIGNELQRRATTFFQGLFKKKKGGG
jgi:AsmA-like protein